MESIKSRVREKINLMFERRDEESTDSDSEGEEDDEDEEEDQRKRIRYTDLAKRSMSHSLAPPARTSSPPPTTVIHKRSSDSPSYSSSGDGHPQSAAMRAFHFFRRKSDPRGTNQSRLRSEEKVKQGQQLTVPLIVHRRRSSIAMTK